MRLIVALVIGILLMSWLSSKVSRSHGGAGSTDSREESWFQRNVREDEEYDIINSEEEMWEQEQAQTEQDFFLWKINHDQYGDDDW